MIKAIRLTGSLLCLVASTGWSQMAPSGAIPPQTTASPQSNLFTPTTSDIDTSYLHYNYYGDRYRDPFVPLTGSSLTNELERPPQIAALALKGIVEDTKGRMALLTSGLDSYVLKNGRLYDGRNRAVKGISGVIKPESVVLIGSDRTVRELRAKPAL